MDAGTTLTSDQTQQLKKKKKKAYASLSVPLVLLLRLFCSRLGGGVWAMEGGLRLASSFLCLSMSSRWELILSCCLETHRWTGDEEVSACSAGFFSQLAPIMLKELHTPSFQTHGTFKQRNRPNYFISLFKRDLLLKLTVWSAAFTSGLMVNVGQSLFANKLYNWVDS